TPDVVLPGRSMRLARRLTIYGPQLYHWLAIESFAQERHDLALTLAFAADFVDVFEVRGHPRPRRGELLPGTTDGHTVRLGYRGLDGALRTTTLLLDPAPTRLDATGAEYRLPLAPGDRVELSLVATAAVEPAAPRRAHHLAASAALRAGVRARHAALPRAAAGHRRRRVHRSRARQDPARVPPWRDGDVPRGPVRAVLRQRGRHAAVRDAGRRVLPLDAGRRLRARDVARRRARAGLDGARGRRAGQRLPRLFAPLAGRARQP